MDKEVTNCIEFLKAQNLTGDQMHCVNYIANWVKTVTEGIDRIERSVELTARTITHVDDWTSEELPEAVGK